MATATVKPKTNGTAKSSNTSTKAKPTAKAKPIQPSNDVKDILAKEGINMQPIVSLADKLQKFEKMKGLANQQEKLATTLTDLTKFKYNQGDSCVFLIRDEEGKEFKTSNTNLIGLVTNQLVHTLQLKKKDVETKLLAFQI